MSSAPRRWRPRRRALPVRSPGCCRSSGTRRPWLRSLGTEPVLPDECIQARIVDRVELQLVIPGGDDHGGREAVVRADQDVGLASGERLEAIDLLLGKIGGVGNPDRAMFQRMDRILVGYGRRVVAAILPDWIVRSSDRWVLGVVHWLFRVLSTRIAVGLDACHGGGATLTTRKDHDARDRDHDESDGRKAEAD